MDCPRPEGDPALTTVFAAVGEHRDDPDHLLLLGEDGRYYAHALPDGPTIPVEPGEEWVIDAGTDRLSGSLGRLPT